MAVYYSKGGGGLFGTIGKMLSLGGSAIPGMQWMTPLGLGMTAANAAMSGDPTGAIDAAMGAVNQYNDMVNPSLHNPVSTVPWSSTRDKLKQQYGIGGF